MKRLLLAATVVAGLAVGAVPTADAAPLAKCSRKELVGVRGGTEGVGASDIINGAAGIVSVDNGDGTSTYKLNVSVDVADGACDGVTYTITATDAHTGAALFSETTSAPAGTTTVILASQRVVATDSVDLVVTTASTVDPELDRAPNTGVNNVTVGVGGGQGWN